MQSTTQKMKEEKILQTNRIFNIAEQHVMNFIAQFLDETPNSIFKDPVPTYVEPLILLPFDEYKKDTCIKFTIKPINLSKENPVSAIKIDNIIMHEKVKKGIGFLWYCIKEVFTSVIDSSMINSKPMDNISIVLDEANWVFRPKYEHDLTIKKTFLEEALGKLMYVKDNIHKFPEKMVNEISQEFLNVINQLKETNENITPEILEDEKNINESYNDKTVLAILVEEVLVNDLPKPILSKDDEDNLNKNNTEIEDDYDIETNINGLFISDNNQNT